MRQELITKFKDFETELDKLKTANEHIETSKLLAQKSLDLLDKASGNLIEHLKETVEKIELKSLAQSAGQNDTFEKLRLNLHNYQEEVKKATENLFRNLLEPTNKFNELAKKSESLISKIDEVNFPKRLDKLENSVNQNFSDILEFNREVNRQSQELIEEIGKIDFQILFSGLDEKIEESIAKIANLNNGLSSEIKKQSEIQIAYSEKLVKTIEEIEIAEKFANLSDLIVKSQDEIKKINSETQIKAETLTKQIESINIPQRLDKLDATIAGITQSIQSVLQRLESLEKNIKDGIQSKTAEIINLLSSNDKETRLAINQVYSTVEAEGQKVIKENKKIKIADVLTFVLLIAIIAILLFNNQ